MYWLLLIISLPTENATARMRAWRALKSAGAAVLRDGVYLLPEREPCRQALAAVAADVQANGGNAFLLSSQSDEAAFPTFFERSADYGALLADIAKSAAALDAASAADVLKQARKWRKAFAAISEIDYFPGEAQRQTAAALMELEAAAQCLVSPDEPHAVEAVIPRLAIADHQGRVWATRRRPWVDRLACAWLIRRFIDPEAQLLWLPSPADCPVDALGFDFDGAVFSHVGARVSFEVMVASFGLDQPALLRLGALVHYLDVGGVQPAEASGVESVLAGLRDAIDDDDQLLAAASRVLDGLYANFNKADGKESP